MTYDIFVAKAKYFDFNLIITNEYFDPFNKEDPIQTVINDQYYVTSSPDRHTEYDVFIQKNTYEIESGGLFSNIKTGEFYRSGDK